MKYSKLNTTLIRLNDINTHRVDRHLMRLRDHWAHPVSLVRYRVATTSSPLIPPGVESLEESLDESNRRTPVPDFGRSIPMGVEGLKESIFQVSIEDGAATTNCNPRIKGALGVQISHKFAQERIVGSIEGPA